MNPHLKHIPSLTTLTVGSLSGGDRESLGGKSDRSLDVEGLVAGTVDELLADLLQGSNLARGQSDTDLVDFLVWCVSLQLLELRGVVDCFIQGNGVYCKRGCVQGHRRNPSRASGKTSLRMVWVRILR